MGGRTANTWLVVGLCVLLVGVTVVLAVTVVEERRWRPVFSEDFTVAVAAGEFEDRYRDQWSVYPDGWRSTNARGTYQPSRTVSVHDGAVDVYVGETEVGPSSAALVPRLPTYGQLYGRYSVRFRADPVPGYKVAFLLWPDSEVWPDDGEIDFPEGNLDGSIGAFAHHADPSGSQDQFPTGQTFARWHIATTEWEPGRIRFYLDDELVGESTTKVPDTSMHWVLQTEVADAPPPAGAEGHVYVDWVKAWALNP
jgi:beta-glucanase (GH16 family)